MRVPFGVLVAWTIFAISVALAITIGIVPELRSERNILADAHQAYIRANSDEIQLRDGLHEDAARRRLSVAVERMRPPASRDVGPSAVLRTVDRLDNRFHVALQRLDAGDDAVRAIPGDSLTLEWSGDYRAVVSAVAALSQGPALIRVVSVRLEHNAKMSASVEAVVHVIVYAAIDTL
jgi:hypothetical protein